MHAFDDTDSGYIDESDYITRPITPLRPADRIGSGEEEEAAELACPDSASSLPRRLPPHRDPALLILFQPHSYRPHGHDSIPDLEHSQASLEPCDIPCDPPSEVGLRGNSAMSGQALASQPDNLSAATLPNHLPVNSRPPETTKRANGQDDSTDAVRNVPADTADAVPQQKRDTNSQHRDESNESLVARPRVDSTQESALEASVPKRPLRTPLRSPPMVEPLSPPQPAPLSGPANESIATSSVCKQQTRVVETPANILPAVQATSPVQGSAATSPQSLPSFSQLTGQLHQLSELNHLKELAEAATATATQEARVPATTSTSHHHSQSFGSTTSQSPRLPYYPHPPVSQTSPVAISLTAKSPISTVSDGPQYGSPQQQHSYTAAYFADRRRSSTATEHIPSFPPPVPSLSSMPSISASSSSESRGRTASTTDGYSTSHTTPIEHVLSADGTPRPILPPPVGMSVPSPFKCDYPDCTHAFTTQYLLSSHKTVHSQIRPHYCPVPGCSRGEGGKGFKRKNEMIRHGLVHSSPGYICPYCPDRNHRYPRPDNLQRHVRVHHVDKDKEDPALREVLSQRAEGTGKVRRRRTQGSIGSST